MRSLLAYIESLAAEFTHLQIANGYDWQQSVRIERGELNQSLSDHSGLAFNDDAAIEFFYNFAEGHQFFIGFKYNKQLKGVDSADEFVERLYALAKGANDIKDLFRSAGIALDNDPDVYLDRVPDRAVELVVNFWEEVGTVAVWKSGEAPLDATSLREKLSSKRDLLRTTKNPIAIEVDYGSPAMWVGIDVSRKDDDEYILQTDIVLAILQIAQSPI